MTQNRSALTLDETSAARFWSRVSLPNADGCMLWSGSQTVDGYGQFRLRRRLQRAARIALHHAIGPGPTDRHQAAHSCRNRHCVAPAHLRWATVTENLHDRDSDGTSNQGSRHGMAKITEDDVREIRRRRAAGETGRAVAAAYGVSPAQITAITNRTAWRHVDG